MKRVTLDIDEQKFDAFIEFIRTLEFVSISEEIEIPDWQKKEVGQRLEKLEAGEISARSWEEAKKEIFKKP